MIPKADDTLGTLFSSPEVGQAVLLSFSPPKRVESVWNLQVHKYDLLANQPINIGWSLHIPWPAKAPFQLEGDLSVDGTMLAIVDPRGHKRVDVCSLSLGSGQFGWIPSEDKTNSRLRWVGFIDAARLLTLDNVGKLVLWDVPSIRALYSLDGCKGVPVFSPGRKTLALFTGRSIEMRDPATGELLGRFGGRHTAVMYAGAFRADGKEFAAIVQGTTGQTLLARWDVTTGELTGNQTVEMVTNDIYHNVLHYCGPDYLRYRDRLIDLKLKKTLIEYTQPGAWLSHPRSSPDGRHWFVAAGPIPTSPAVVASRSIPDKDCLELAKQLSVGDVTPFLAPGTTVRLRVDGAVPSGDTEFLKQIADRVRSRLEQAGLTVSDTGKVSLTVKIDPVTKAGAPLELAVLGADGRRRLELVDNMQIAVRATVQDERARELWSCSVVLESRAPLELLRTDDVQAGQMKRLLDDVRSWSSSLPALEQILRTGESVLKLPRQVALEGDR